MPLGCLHIPRQRHRETKCVSSCVPVFAAGRRTHKRVSLLLADVPSASCIIYVLCALSAVHKSQMLLLSAGPGAVNMLEQDDSKPNNNKQVFSGTINSHFGTNNNSGAGGGGGGSSGLLTAGGLKLQGLFSSIFFLSGRGLGSFSLRKRGAAVSFFFCHQVDEGVSLRLSRLLSLERSLGRVTRDSLRAKQTAVTYGEDVQPCVRATQHERPGTLGTISEKKTLHF